MHRKWGRGRYNEIETEAGYGLKLGDFAAKAAYIYKACGGDEPNTQEVELEFEYDAPWVTPFLGLNCDIDKWSGALYGVFGLRREWELVAVIVGTPVGSTIVGVDIIGFLAMSTIGRFLR